MYNGVSRVSQRGRPGGGENKTKDYVTPSLNYATVYVCMYVYACAYEGTRVCTFAHMHVCTYAFISTYTHIVIQRTNVSTFSRLFAALQNTTLYNTYSLFHLHICQVCGSFQCPYCPFYNTAVSVPTTSALGLFLVVAGILCLRAVDLAR